MLRILLLSFFYLIIRNSGVFGLRKDAAKFVVTKSFDNCPDSKQLAMVYISRGMDLSNPHAYITDYDMIVKKDITNVTRMEIRAERCRSKENPDTCSHFTTFKTNYICHTLRAKNEFWSPFSYNCTKPRYECPIKKNIYHGKNCSMDLDKFNWLPMDCSYWKIEMAYFDRTTNEKLLCTRFEGSIC